ncbi:MAG: hypothetical protein V3T70_10065 [Phycisphaerae bacterium]
MSFNFGSSNRVNCQKVIKNNQQLFKRFFARFKKSKNPGERTFLKCEMSFIASELKQFVKQWKKARFGSTTWITNGFNAPRLTNSGTWTTSGRKTAKKSTRKTSARKTTVSGRKSTSSRRRTTSMTTRRTRSTAARSRYAYAR